MCCFGISYWFPDFLRRPGSRCAQRRISTRHLPSSFIVIPVVPTLTIVPVRPVAPRLVITSTTRMCCCWRTGIGGIGSMDVTLISLQSPLIVPVRVPHPTKHPNHCMTHLALSLGMSATSLLGQSATAAKWAGPPGPSAHLERHRNPSLRCQRTWRPPRRPSEVFSRGPHLGVSPVFQDLATWAGLSTRPPVRSSCRRITKGGEKLPKLTG